MTENQIENMLYIESLRVPGMAFIPLSGGPFNGRLQHLPYDSPDRMFLKKAPEIGQENPLPSVQHVYRLLGLCLVYQGDERI